MMRIRGGELALVKFDLATTWLKIVALERELERSRSLVGALKDKWEKN